MESDTHSPQRIFLGWDRPVLPAATSQLVEHYAQGSTANMRSATVVLPGRRARRRIVELLVEAAAERHLTLVPPNVTTVGHVPELLYTSPLPAVDAVMAPRAWSKALRVTDAAALRQVFPHVDADAPLREWDELARLMGELHQSLAGEGHDFGDVARICRTGLLFDDSRRWDVLAQVQRRYLELLATAGMADPFEARRAVLRSGVRPHAGDVWLVAVAELPSVTWHLLEASNAPVYALVQAPSEMADQEPAPFDEWGLPVPEVWETARIPVTDAVLRMVERPVDQADAAVVALEELDPRYSTEDVILGVHPQAEVVPYLQQRLAARGVGARYAAGTPLTRTAPVRLLQAVSDYLDGQTYPAMAALLRHPDAPALFTSIGADVRGGHALDISDAYFNRHLPFTLGGSLPSGRGLGADFPSMVRALVAEGPLRPFRDRKPISRWMAVVMHLLEQTYDQGELDRSRPEHRHLADVLSALRTVALALDGLPPALDEECTGAEAIRAVLAGVADKALPPDPDPAAVELLEWLEIPVDDAPVVVLTGFNEGFVPDSVTGHPFLPDSLRQALGLLDNRRRMARDAYRLTCVLHSKEQVRLIAGRRTAKGDPLRPSRLMFRTAPEALAPRILRFLDDRERSPSGTDLGALGLAPAAESAFTVPPERVIELPADRIPTSISVTAFRSLLDDPYRFVLEKVFGLERVDDGARELDPMEFGSLAHRVLQRFGEMILADPPEVDVADADAMARALVELLRQEVDIRFGRSALPAVQLQAAQLEERLKAFAARQAQWTASGWKIMAVECKPGEDGWPLDVDGTPILVKGRIDRIDHNPTTGAWAVLDYKTGSKAKTPEDVHRTRRANARAWVDLQLPLYRHMIEAVRGPTGERLVPAGDSGAVGLGYIVLPQDPAECAFLLAEWTDEAIDSAVEVAREAVRGLRSGRFEFDPGKTRPGPEGWDDLRPLLAVGWQAAGGAEAADGEGVSEAGEVPS